MRRGFRPPLFLLIFGLVLVTLFVSQLVAAGLLAIIRPPPPAALGVDTVIAEIAQAGPRARLESQPVARPAQGPSDPLSTSGRLAAQIAAGLGLPPDAVQVQLSRMQRDRYILVDAGQPGTPRIVPTLVGEFRVKVREPDGSWTVYSPKGEGIFDVVEKRYILLFIVGAALMLPLAWWLSRVLARPFMAFAENAERVGRDPALAVTPPSGPAEVARASEALSVMARRLHAYVTDRTQMVGALAHDFRTPLMRIAFRIEGLEPELRDSLADDVRQLESMVASTLAFVRGEQALASRDRLELASLVEGVADSFAWQERPVRVVKSEPAVVEGDAIALRRLFTNLVENAIAYGGAAEIRIGLRDGEAVVDVDDNGPGLPEAELVRVFEPFYRAEPSRNRDTGGMGLGLPLAARIASAHGGSLTLSNRVHGGLRARVRLPLAGQQRAAPSRRTAVGAAPSTAKQGQLHGGPETGVGARSS
ncbi:MAG: HAMP domain-containing sensor histidine kinase [Sphingomonadaceae bacterium]